MLHKSQANKSARSRYIKNSKNEIPSGSMVVLMLLRRHNNCSELIVAFLTDDRWRCPVVDDLQLIGCCRYGLRQSGQYLARLPSCFCSSIHFRLHALLRQVCSPGTLDVREAQFKQILTRSLPVPTAFGKGLAQARQPNQPVHAVFL